MYFIVGNYNWTVNEPKKEEDIEVTIPEDEINKPTEEHKLNNDFKNKLFSMMDELKQEAKDFIKNVPNVLPAEEDFSL